MALVPTLLAAPVASRPLAASIADALGVAQSGGAMTSLTDAARVTDAREEEKQARARALLAACLYLNSLILAIFGRGSHRTC